MRRRVVVTGIGLVSAAGASLDANLAALASGTPAPLATEPFSGYPVHPVVPLEWDRQIPKRSDQRQMEPWQRLGCYAAGLALDDAGLKDDAALKSRIELIVAAGGGERDYAVDGQILTGLREAASPGAYLNEHLLGDLRPTLFLAQLSNLAAGNIAIVHGVTGASRTFMGEEQSGVDALRIAEARIAAGQADIMLVGASYNAERPDVMLTYELGGFYWTKPWRPVVDRAGDGGGFVLGSAGAFLVLEAEGHAAGRGAVARAVLSQVGVVRTRREPGSVSRALGELWDGVCPDAPDLVITGATGVAPVTAEEAEALARLAPGVPCHQLGDRLGHTMEAQPLVGAALAAGLVSARTSGRVLVASVGHRRGEGLVLLSATG